MKKLCKYVGVKTSKKYSKTSPLYKKLKSLGIKGFSRGGVVDVDDISKQVKANGDTTLISAKDIVTTCILLKFINKESVEFATDILSLYI